MSLLICKWKKEFGPEVKEAIRKEITEGFGALTGIAPEYFAVCFEDYPEGDFPEMNIGVFVLVHQTEGRDEGFKDEEVRMITEAFCRHTGWEPARVSIMIHDILKGSMGVNGVIVNREAAAAEVIKADTLKI